MFFKSYIRQSEEIFLRQFEEDGERFLYRKHGRGAPIPVTPEEREEFRRQYGKASGRLIWAVSLVTIVAIGLVSVIVPEFVDEGPGIVVIVLAVIGAISVLSIRNFTSPARALDRRSPVGNELTKDEWHSRHFATTSWPLLISIFLVSVAVFASFMWRSNFEELPDYLWTLGSAVLSVLGARALWLKYHLAR